MQLFNTRPPKMVKLTTHVTADHKAALELISESAGKHASEAAVLRMALDRGLPVLQLQMQAERAADGRDAPLTPREQQALQAIAQLAPPPSPPSQ